MTPALPSLRRTNRARGTRGLRRARTGALVVALLALGGCVSIPTGPSVATFPGTGRWAGVRTTIPA